VTEDEPTVQPEEGEGDASDPLEELREELQKPVEGEERELTPQEGEQLRRATARIRQVLNPQIQSVLTHIGRTGVLAKFSADMNKLGRPNFPDSVLKGVLGKGLPASTLQQLLPKIAVEPSWMKQMKLINSDIYKMSGLGQSNLTKFSSLLAKNADFGFDKTAAKLVEQFAAEQTSWLKTIGPLLARIKTSFYPTNLEAIEDLEFEEVEAVVMLDGIALYGVPRTEIAEKLVRAASTAERRTILGRRWKAISSDCRAALEGCTSATVAPYVKFGLRALDALEGEHVEAAQTLAASILDTVVNGYFGKQRYDLTPNRRTTTAAEYEKFTLKEFIAFAPLWQAYQKYKTEDGDPIPTTFSRHASVHGVSAKQFSRRNAVQAVLFLSSLLVFLDEEASSVEAA
jgi:hypothetical protein